MERYVHHGQRLKGFDLDGGFSWEFQLGFFKLVEGNKFQNAKVMHRATCAASLLPWCMTISMQDIPGI
eukprot:9900535-Lingulodinium_polyedra.AAC.1